MVWEGPRDPRRHGRHPEKATQTSGQHPNMTETLSKPSSVCTARHVGSRTNNMFISSHRSSCGLNARADVLLGAEVENDGGSEDPGEVRQTHRVSSYPPSPDVFGDGTLASRIDHAAVDEMLLVPRRHSAGGDEPRHLPGNPWSKTPSLDTVPQVVTPHRLLHPIFEGSGLINEHNSCLFCGL